MKQIYAKSQVTILIVIGLLLFIVVGLVLYLTKSAIKKPIQQNVEQIQETAIDVQPIKEFVNECLNKLSKDALVLIGKQGGVIYNSQGGTLVDHPETDEGIFFVNHNNYKVAYNIKQPPTYSIFPYASNIPNYPWITFPYITKDSDEQVFYGFFGVGNIPPLTPTNGPNSMQTQIEAYIDNNMGKCIDISTFEKQDYQVEVNKSKTQSIIGSEDVRIRSIIPIKIINKATNEFTHLEEFSTVLNVRLRIFYSFIRQLVEEDISNIKFNIINPNNDRDSMSVSLIQNVNSNDDIVVMTDAKSLIYGKPFEYVFARQNRRPSLYYLRHDVIRFPHDYVIQQSDILQGQTLKAEDPDEDDHYITISPLESDVSIPALLNKPEIRFKVEVSDGQLTDHQIITIIREQ